MKKSKETQDRDANFAAYVDTVVTQKLATEPRRPKPVCPEGLSREEWILSMQPKSTQALIAKHNDPDYVRDWSAPLPDNVLANPNAKTQDELVGKRQLDPTEIAHFEAVRRRPKNTIGQPTKSATTREAKERAVDHFMSLPPAFLTQEDEQRIIDQNTRSIKSSNAVVAQAKEVWVPLTLWQAIKHWLSGGKVERRPDEPNRWGQWK